MILLDDELNELGEVNIDIDFEIGTSTDATNDFQLTNATIQSANAKALYIPGTEYGGIFEYTQEKTGQDYVKLKGYTWRGLLAYSVILPPAGADYKIVSGEANTILADMLQDFLGGFFTVSTVDSGCVITDYQFPLYINLLDGLELMLESYGYRLKITGKKVESGQPIVVEIAATRATVISGTFDEDNGLPMTFTLNNMGVNHLICGGQGELQERMIRHLYIDENGDVSDTQYYTGFKERTQFYDYPNAESEEDLIQYGTERLKELASTKTLNMDAPTDLNLEIGDIVVGVFPDGTTLRSPIIKKIYKIKNGEEKFEYKIKGET